jgi:hypothetical protein
VRQPKKERKDGGKQTHRIVEQIRVKQILGDVLDLVLNATSASQLRKVLNSASWKIKKAILIEALELGHIDRANNLATQILNLTEVKEKKLSGNIGMDINESVQILMAEITDVPFHVLEERAKQIRELKYIGHSGTGADRGRDEASEPGEVLVVEDVTVHKQS